ncbi:MAG: lysophospholipid acyltransferase family protein [Anaerolineae bacterium]
MTTPEEFHIKRPIWGLRTGSKIFMRLFSDYRVIGKQNVPRPPFLLTFNHLAFWDAPAIGGAVEYPTPAFAAKKYQNKPIGLLFYVGIPIWIEQESPDRHALMAALKIIEHGYLFAIAPEGGRSSSGVLKPGLEGVAFIATRANVPILPIGLWGTNQLFRQVRPTVRVVVGKPYRLPEGRARGNQLTEYTERIMCAIAALIPEQYHGHYAGNPLIAEMAKQVI